MKAIRTKANFLIISIMTLLVIVFLTTITQDKKRILDEKTQTHRQLLRNSFNLALEETKQGITSLAYDIAKDRAIVDAFDEKDRELLYTLTKPYFDKAKEEQKVDVTGFIGADGVHFLRMQDPNLYGDSLLEKRPVLAKAIREKKALTSIDVTIYNVSIISVVPMFKYNKYLGSIHTVAHIKRVQDKLNGYSNITSAIIFDTKTIQKVLPNNNFKTIKNYSIVSSNSDIFEHLSKDYDLSDNYREKINDKDYLIATRPLLNAQGDQVAMIICAFDISDDVLAYKKDIITLVLLSIILLIGVSIILNYAFNLMLKRIEKDTLLTKELNNKLAYQIMHEPLTSLPNRYALLEALSKKQHYGLALINIDGFKEINDFYGHDFGDKVLLALSQLLKQIIKTNPLDLYKMPSDEFAIALSKPLSSNELNEIFKNISTLMQTHSYNIENISLYVTYSIGVCIDDKLSYELLSNADIALKTAKKQNTNLVYYSDELQAKKDYQNNILWSKKLKDAISKNRFKIFYQPIFNAKTHKILKYEALIRMVDEDGSIVAPYIFLPAAKKTRLYPHITKFIIDGIFEKLEQTNYTFSINISILDILNLKTTEYIFSKLASSKHSNRVIFELLESEGVENYNEVIDFISKIKSYGARVAIDDFGTGYSNFAHIIKLNINILKIDGSLIKNIDTDKNAQTIVTSIVEFSKQLDIEVVAEFVHSKEVLDKCVELGISHLQGFYLAQPQELN